jgi:hypothetical protein
VNKPSNSRNQGSNKKVAQERLLVYQSLHIHCSSQNSMHDASIGMNGQLLATSFESELFQIRLWPVISAVKRVAFSFPAREFPGYRSLMPSMSFSRFWMT